MIRIVVIQDKPLFRGALSAALQQEDDLDVIAEASLWRELVAQAAPVRPDVMVLDLDNLGEDPLAVAAELRRALGGARALIVLDAERHDVLARADREALNWVGFVTKRASLGHLLSALRSLASGWPVIDPDLVLSVLSKPKNPLTKRERDILALAAEGAPAGEIARQLYLSAGTVRNSLSRINAKTGASNRIEAIHLARRAGWL